MEIVLVLVFPLVVLGVLGFAVLALVNGRSEPDPSGRRPYATYLVLVTFVALFTTVFALARAASSGTRAAMNTPLGECTAGPGSISCTSGSGGFGQSSGAGSAASGGTAAPFTRPATPNPAAVPGEAPRPGVVASPPPAVAPPPLPTPALPTPALPAGFVLRGGPDARKERAREAVQAGLVALAAALVLAFHGRRLRDLVAEAGFEQGSAKRPYVFYLYATCFVSVITALASGSLAAYALVRVIAPGLMTSGAAGPERDEGLVGLVTNGLLTGAAALIFATHWRRTRQPGGSLPVGQSAADTAP